MYDLSADLQTFYDQHVRLGQTLRSDLAKKRDLNLDRLNLGLHDLAEETKYPRPHPCAWYNQGSYAMHTLNQDPADENDYDIDVGIVFNKADLPFDPLKARQRIADALCKRCTNFTQEPTAKTNAVRVAYADGYHIDFAVYRTYEDSAGILQTDHASTEWKPRDPAGITTWFDKCVRDKSPTAAPALGYYPKVKDGQFRRITRFVKWFARSRASWSLPGGLIVTTLVSEVYVKDDNRDDRSLYDTLCALANRLNVHTKVYNPVSGTQFTENAEIQSQVDRLKTQLNMAIAKLKPLFDQQNCTREKGRSAWDWVFNHAFWAEKEVVTKSALDEMMASAAMPYSVAIRCDLTRKDGINYREYRSGSSVLQKNVKLKSTLVRTNVSPPYFIEWEVRNSGDEASDEGDLQHTTGQSHDLTHSTSTAFKGNHRMICKIFKNGSVVAQVSHVVKVAPGRWWRR